MSIKNEWKWSNGDIYDKSIRTHLEHQVSKHIEYNSQKNAINMSLGCDELSSTNYQEEPEHKKKILDNNTTDRQMFQCGTNPFMGQTSYIDDVVIRDMYLKPINTTQGSHKKNNGSNSDDLT